MAIIMASEGGKMVILEGQSQVISHTGKDKTRIFVTPVNDTLFFPTFMRNAKIYIQ